LLAISIDVEFATFSDAVEISELSRKYIEYGLRRVYTPSRIRYLMRNTSKNVVVARKDRALFALGIMTYREDSANLDLLAVKKLYRRRGVGTQVVRWLEKVARTAGITNIFVQVRKTNASAIRFYETLGFHIVEEAAGYYQGRETCVIMCKGLRQMVGSIQGVNAMRYAQ
jgi:ribosomal-protein-alanine N-acetyltransferase